MRRSFTRWALGYGVVAAFLLGGGALSATATTPTPTKLKLKTGATIEGAFLKRDTRGWIFLRATGSGAEIGVPKTDVESVEFDLKLDDRRVPELLEDREYADAARELRAALDPVLGCLDLPGNLAPWVEWWIKCLYFSGQHQELRGASVFLESLPAPRHKQAAVLYRALARLGLGFADDAEREARRLGAVNPRDEEAAMYYFVVGNAQLARGDVRAAQESAAIIVAHHPRNLEWLPGGLLLSAQGYVAAGETNVARVIISEINTIALRSHWSELAGELGRTIGMATAPPPAADEPSEAEKEP